MWPLCQTHHWVWCFLTGTYLYEGFFHLFLFFCWITFGSITCISYSFQIVFSYILTRPVRHGARQRSRHGSRTVHEGKLWDTHMWDESWQRELCIEVRYERFRSGIRHGDENRWGMRHGDYSSGQTAKLEAWRQGMRLEYKAWSTKTMGQTQEQNERLRQNKNSIWSVARVEWSFTKFNFFWEGTKKFFKL